ncbi:MAG TPA: carboxymuconolactone decarboxylase family protein [Candidatus Limnocylindria bacterium]|nr:carboxymuconolactone decarboxylase family protein [Candidatus Limnocylindria bacterium]
MTPRLPSPAPGHADPMARSVLAHLPESLGHFQALYAALWQSPHLDPVTKEIARVRNARLTGCGYCRNVRFEAPRAAGLTEATLDLVADGYEASTLSPRHKAVLRFTDAFLTDPTSLTPTDHAELLTQLTPLEIIELTAALALFMGFSKIAVALGTAPDDMPLTVLPTPGS